MPLTSAFAAAISDVQGRRDDDLYQRQIFERDRIAAVRTQARYEQDYQLRADDFAFRKDQASEQRKARDWERGRDTLDRARADIDAGYSGPRDPIMNPPLSDMGTTGAPTTMPGELSGMPAPAPTFDPTQSVAYRTAEAAGEQANRLAVDRSVAMADAGAGTGQSMSRFVTGGRHMQYNPKTGETSEVMGPEGEPLVDPSRGITPAEAEKRAAMVYPRAVMGMEEVMSLVDKFGGAPGLSSMWGEGISRFAQDEEIQRFNAGARAVVSAILRVESGAAISIAEVNDMMNTMVPRPGDKPETVEMKLGILQAQVEAMRRAASTVPGGGEIPVSGQGGSPNPYRR